MTTDIIQEIVQGDSSSWKVDRGAAIIRGVKILGLESRNGRRYTDEAARGAASLYEGVKVNVNHPKGSSSAPRDYQDRLGSLANILYRPGEGLYGELRFNPKHALADQLVWDAEHAPGNVGLSHNVEARTARHNDQVIVEAIVRVLSVDLVADPATTTGLFEGHDQRSTRRDGDVPPWEAWSLADWRRERPELVEEATRPILEVLEQARYELALQRAEVAAGRRRALVERRLREAGLPSLDENTPWARSLLGETFVRQLMEARDEDEVGGLVEERARLIQCARRGDRDAGRCRSREQWLTSTWDESPGTAQEFARRLLGR